MLATKTEIMFRAAKIRASALRLTTGVVLSPNLLADLRGLGEMCGLVANDRVTDNDLISIFLVALKDAASAYKVAARIQSRLDGYGFPDPIPEPTKPNPAWPPTADPEDPYEPKAPGPLELRRLIKEEVREGALRPLQAVMDELSESIEAIPARASAKALEALNGVIEQAAHAAATNALKNLTPTRIDISLNNAPPIAMGLVHRKTPLILAALAARVNVYLHGPAGSGKTTVGRKTAEAFKVQFYFAAKVESEYQLMGFKDAKGETVRTPFRNAYEHGGVFLFDELDASSPSAVVALNAALANGICPFPDGIVSRHTDFYCIGAGNTKLTGANRQYAGRNQLDAASIDRFAFIEFDYDDDLERALATDRKWCDYVQSVRAAVAERGIAHLVTPRATYDGCALLTAGLDWDTVASMCVYKGLDADTVKQLEKAAADQRTKRAN